jgi:hypothetical protein
LTLPMPVKFWGGNMGAAGTITINDLQIYDYALTNGQVAGLSRGVGFVC